MTDLQGNRDGTVLIVVAGIIAALALLGVSFILLVGSKSRQTRSFVRMEQSRQASIAAVEYCCAALKYVCDNSASYLSDIVANDVDEAVEEANRRIFDNQSQYSLRNLNHKTSTVICDAYNFFADSNSPLGALTCNGAAPSEETVSRLDPVGAVYTAKFEYFVADDFDESAASAGTSSIGESQKDIVFYGWGRAFDKLDEGSYAPVCDHAVWIKLALKLEGTVTIDSVDPTNRTYAFVFSVVGIKQRGGLEIDEDNPQWPWAAGEGLPWFLQQ
ncbi:MAG: hypothetical protein Kow00107_02380 [Planctomycetota bacterium]